MPSWAATAAFAVPALIVIVCALPSASALGRSEQKNLYNVEVLSRSATPIVSSANAMGRGYSPCNNTFNPSFLPQSAGLPTSGLFVRLNQCPPSMAGGSSEHIGFVPCSSAGVCGDVSTTFALEASSEDPRVIYNPVDSFYYNFYFANYDSSNPDHCVGGGNLCTVKLARSKTPLQASSWQHITTLPW
jgi:hypothetical protein